MTRYRIEAICASCGECNTFYQYDRVDGIAIDWKRCIMLPTLYGSLHIVFDDSAHRPGRVGCNSTIRFLFYDRTGY